MSHSYSIRVFILLLLRIFKADAAGMRGNKPTEWQVSMQEVESSLFAELDNSYRAKSSKDHLSNLEVALRPMYTALPKEPEGTLNHAVVRYALHRFFVHQHGWFIRGLEPGTGSTIPSEEHVQAGLQELQEWVPSYLQRFIEKIHGKAGIGLRDLSIVASTIDDLIHKESVAHLNQSFESLDISTRDVLDAKTTRLVLEVWMMIYHLGGKLRISGREKVMKAHEVFTTKKKNWEEIQEWVHAIQRELFPSQETVSFSDLVRVVEEASRRFSVGVINKECTALKAELVSIESKKAGRVRLPEFYKKGLHGVFEFTEKVDYLRNQGALDESDPNQTYVIVTNYVTGRQNCMKASALYVICCRNECEDFMSALEKKISGALGSPQQILETISAMTSSKTSALPNAGISVSLAQRLQDIATLHHGSVPIHGRLFAQWMHHAFPRECPYPHGNGTISPQTPDEWMEETGQNESKASTEEMMEHINNDNCAYEPVGDEARKHHQSVENELPWDDSEVLLVRRPTGPQPKQRSIFGCFTPFAILSSLATSLVFFGCKYLLKKGKHGEECLPMHAFGKSGGISGVLA